MSSTFPKFMPAASARSLARWMTGPSAIGIGERNPELEDVRARLHHRMHHRNRGGGARIAGGDERDEGGPVPGPERRESVCDPAHR